MSGWLSGLTPARGSGSDDEAAENSIGVKLLPFLEAEGCVPAKFSLATLSGTFELLRGVESAASETGSSLEGVDAKTDAATHRGFHARASSADGFGASCGVDDAVVFASSTVEDDVR